MRRRPNPLVEPCALWQLTHIGAALMKSLAFFCAAFTFVVLRLRPVALVWPALLVAGAIGTRPPT